MADIMVEDIPSFILDKLGGPSEFKRPEEQKNKMGEVAGQQIAQGQPPGGGIVG